MPRVVLKDLRELFVMVLHPADKDGSLLHDQLRRIGCRTEAVWSPPKILPPHVDVVFAGISRDHQRALQRVLRRGEGPAPAVIALVDYENPAMLQLVLDIEAVAVISKPVRPFGLLTNLAVARNAWLEQQALLEKVAKVEARLSGQKRIAKAKSIIMETQGVTEQIAYKTIRSQAMSKRISVDEMAVAIINANDLLLSRPDEP
ncbi:MAG: ANTAR domain-containing protein [Pseudomonadota bacterium]